MEPQLLSYINGSRQRGDSDVTIRATLISHGWRPVIVDQAIDALTPEPTHHSHRGLILKAALALSLLIVPYLTVNLAVAMHGNIQSNAQTTERTDDTDTLQILLEDYKNRAGSYPTRAEANDPLFRVEKLRAYDLTRFTTPGGTETILGALPASNGYGYEAYAADKKPCDNKTVLCTLYELDPGGEATLKANL